MEEQKEQVAPKESKVEKEKKVVEKAAEAAKAAKDAPKKGRELTPQEKRAANAMVLQVTLFADGQLEVKSIKNINSRAMAEYLVSRAKDDYFKADVANLAAVRLIDLIQQGQKNKKKTGGLWTPGVNK